MELGIWHYFDGKNEKSKTRGIRKRNWRMSIFRKLSCSLCFLVIITGLSNCRFNETEIVEPLTVSWSSYEEDGGAITLRWISSGVNPATGISCKG